MVNRDLSELRAWVSKLPLPLFSSRVQLAPSSLHGQGLHALEDIIPGEILIFDQGEAMHESVVALLVQVLGHENALRLDWDTYAVDAPVNGGAYLNHSCDPNVGFTGARTLVALKHIKRGEELLLDYAMSETWQGWSMPCCCGSPRCRKTITGNDHAIPEVRERLGRWFSPFLRRHWNIDSSESQRGMNSATLEGWVRGLPKPTINSRVSLRPSRIHGQGLHACANLRAGEIIVVDEGVRVHNSIVQLVTAELNHQNDLAVGHEYSLLDAPLEGGAYANHSCDPNLGLANERTFITLRAVQAGEELCPDYGTFAADPAWRMPCCCKAPHCRGLVTGRDYQDSAFRTRLGRWFSPYLQ